MSPDLRPPGSPPGLQPPGSRASATIPPAVGSNRLHRMVWILLGFVVVLTLAVLVVLPYLVAERSVDESGIDKPIQDTVSAPVSSSPPLAAGVARHDAEQALQAFLRIRAQPDLANAEVWAAEPWSRALETAAGGDEHYGRGRFSEALSAYKEAAQQLLSVQVGRPQRLADSLARGWQSLQQNDVETAMTAFDRVLAMQSDHEEAVRGLASAGVRNQVLALMEDGRQAQANNDLQRAAHTYTAALQLDPSHVSAQTALQQVNGLLAGLAFQDAMSDALQSLESGDFSAVDEALRAAAKVYPEAPAMLDARQRLAEARRQSALNSLRKQAAKRAASEQWSVAIDLYRQALAIDAQAAYAHSGLSHAQKRLQLHTQLDHYLEDLARLSSDQPRQNAEILLQVNKRIPENEPRLAAKVAALEEAVRLADLPVNLLIQSDNLTEVTVYHVGRLGKFDQKQIALRPGSYTVIGSRPGYRDVRKVITLGHDATTNTIRVRCEELI